MYIANIVVNSGNAQMLASQYMCHDSQCLGISFDCFVVITPTEVHGAHIVESCSDDDDILTCRFEFNQMLEKTAFLEKQVQDLSSQLELLADESKNAESEKDELKLLLSNAQVAFRETQEELQAVTEKGACDSNWALSHIKIYVLYILTSRHMDLSKTARH